MSQNFQGASFKGVPFFVDASQVKVGRRNVVHEYPQRDMPFVEDLGRATRAVSVEAFLIGEDCLSQAKRLMAAIESQGSGTLIHPWLGEMRVSLTATSTLSFDERKRIVKVTLEAVEAGELDFPKTSSDLVSLAGFSAGKLLGSAIEKFGKSIDLSIASKFIDDALALDVETTLGVVSSSQLSAVFGFSDKLKTLIKRGARLITTDPKVFAQEVANAMGIGRFSTEARSWGRVARQLSNLTKRPEVNRAKLAKTSTSGRKGPGSSQFNTPLQSKPQQIALQNRTAIEKLVRHVALANAVGVATLVASDSDVETVELVETGKPHGIGRSFEEIHEIQTAILEAFDAEMMVEEDDEIYQSLSEARSAAHAVLQARADGFGHLVTVETFDVMPALAMAYDWHDDATRDEEIAIRNGVQHSGFCPERPMRILDDAKQGNATN